MGRVTQRRTIARVTVSPAGAETITTHDLRRTFISHLIVGLGLDPVRVSKIAGHSNVSVTLNIYAEEYVAAVLTKRLGPGFAARDAVTSAFLAADGLTGTREPLEGKAGFFNLYMRGEVRPELLTDGERYRENIETAKKYFESLKGPSVDAALERVHARCEDIESHHAVVLNEFIRRIKPPAPAAAR